MDPVMAEMSHKIISSINQMLESIASKERITFKNVNLTLNNKTASYSCQILCPICSKSCAISFVRGKSPNIHNFKRHFKMVHVFKEYQSDEVTDNLILKAKDPENCFVCNEFIGPFKNELTVLTGYSEKSICSILGKIFFKVHLLIYCNSFVL